MITYSCVLEVQVSVFEFAVNLHDEQVESFPEKGYAVHSIELHHPSGNESNIRLTA